MRRVQALIASLFVANLLCLAVLGQQPRKYPPFTAVTRFTEYDAKGQVVRVSTFTRYQASNGDWRSVTKSGVDEQAAYRASFKPQIVEGRPVVAKGIIDYQFVLPK